MKFEIDMNSLCDVKIEKEWGMYDHIPLNELSHEQLIKIIKGEDRCKSLSHDDHPEFKELRNELEQKGFIKCERGWWNGDRVLKRFTLNGAIFRKDEKFCSGAAIKWDVEHKQKDKRYKTI
jgi:hypothetical protein